MSKSVIKCGNSIMRVNLSSDNPDFELTDNIYYDAHSIFELLFGTDEPDEFSDTGCLLMMLDKQPELNYIKYSIEDYSIAIYKEYCIFECYSGGDVYDPNSAICGFTGKQIHIDLIKYLSKELTDEDIDCLYVLLYNFMKSVLDEIDKFHLLWNYDI